MRKRAFLIGLSALLIALGVQAGVLAGTPARIQYENPIATEPTAQVQPPAALQEQPPQPPEQPPAPPELEEQEEGGVAGATGPTEEPGLGESVTEALPFTGFQAGLVLIGGLALAATGLVLRRVSRKRDT